MVLACSLMLFDGNAWTQLLLRNIWSMLCVLASWWFSQCLHDLSLNDDCLSIKCVWGRLHAQPKCEVSSASSFFDWHRILQGEILHAPPWNRTLALDALIDAIWLPEANQWLCHDRKTVWLSHHNTLRPLVCSGAVLRTHSQFGRCVASATGPAIRFCEKHVGPAIRPFVFWLILWWCRTFWLA